MVIEREAVPFLRATYINQARIHMGYHYPRSYSTATKSANYFERFVNDYRHCVHQSFTKIYATSATYSWSSGQQFEKFCNDAGIYCRRVSTDKYFRKGLCDQAFVTKEYAFDAKILGEFFISEIGKHPNVKLMFDANIEGIKEKGESFEIALTGDLAVSAPFVLNATYASTNQIIEMLGFEKFKIKYELCEMILCTVDENLEDVGITVMDGPFFSIMPFGKTGYHSLTSVTFTPHATSYEALPSFLCQEDARNHACSVRRLSNCNSCPAKPKSAWTYMSRLAGKYLKDEYRFEYVDSLYSIKPILTASEIDDSRPTVIRKHSDTPTFVSVLSGKINTVYDLDEVLING